MASSRPAGLPNHKQLKMFRKLEAPLRCLMICLADISCIVDFVGPAARLSMVNIDLPHMVAEYIVEVVSEIKTVLSDHYPNFLYDDENMYCRVLHMDGAYIFEFKTNKAPPIPTGLAAAPCELAAVKAARAFFVKKAVDEALAARAAAGPPPPRPGDCDDPTTEQIIYEELN